MRLTIATLKCRDMLDLCECWRRKGIKIGQFIRFRWDFVSRNVRNPLYHRTAVRSNRGTRRHKFYFLFCVLFLSIHFLLLCLYLPRAVNPDEIEDVHQNEFDDLSKLFNDEQENVVMKALDGFLIVLSTDGDVVFVAENINDYLGIQQVNDKWCSLRPIDISLTESV